MPYIEYIPQSSALRAMFKELALVGTQVDPASGLSMKRKAYSEFLSLNSTTLHGVLLECVKSIVSIISVISDSNPVLPDKKAFKFDSPDQVAEYVKEVEIAWALMAKYRKDKITAKSIEFEPTLDDYSKMSKILVIENRIRDMFVSSNLKSYTIPGVGKTLTCIDDGTWPGHFVCKLHETDSANIDYWRERSSNKANVAKIKSLAFVLYWQFLPISEKNLTLNKIRVSDLKKKTVTELRQLGKELSIPFPAGITKVKMIELIGSAPSDA